MRILHLCAPATFGGLESVIRMLATGQKRVGHEVHVATVLTELSTSLDQHPFLQDLATAGVRVHPLRLPAARAYREERRQIDRLCGELMPDVCHTHGYRSDVLHAPVARRRGIPSVTTVHGFTGGDWKVRLYEKLQERAFRSFSGVVAVSRPIVDRLRRSGVDTGRLHLVQNGWHRSELMEPSAARARLGLGAGSHIGWVGRLSREKGPDIALDALGMVPDETVTLSMIGEGPEREALERRAVELGLGGRVRFPGAIRNAGSLLSGFDALLLSSRTEGTPIVLLEAMAAGVPIVATAVGGVPHMLTRAEAVLTETTDPGALAEGIRQTLLNPEQARARTVAATARLARDFDTSSWVGSYTRIYLAACQLHQLETAA